MLLRWYCKDKSVSGFAHLNSFLWAKIKAKSKQSVGAKGFLIFTFDFLLNKGWPFGTKRDYLQCIYKTDISIYNPNHSDVKYQTRLAESI